MTKAENEELEIDSFQLSDNTDVEIVASENDVVLVEFLGETLRNTLTFYPEEAGRIAQAMLKAVEHIKARKA